MTSDRSYATRVGSTKFIRWVLLGVNVKEAVKGGVRFLRANRHVWQTAFVDARLLNVLEQHDKWAGGEIVGGASKHHGDDRTPPVPSRRECTSAGIC